MATGMEMLLGKMLGGLNPQAIQEQVQTAATHAQAVIADFKAQMTRIEANQQVLYQLLLKAGLIEPVESLRDINSAVTPRLEENFDGNGKPN